MRLHPIRHPKPMIDAGICYGRHDCPAEDVLSVAAALVLAALATLWLARKFQRWLGGYTGDCLGATQQIAEIVFYLGLTANLYAQHP